MKTLLLILKVLPIVLAIERYRPTKEATQEVLDALDTNAELMVARAALARASVPADPGSVLADAFNRDNDHQAKSGSVWGLDAQSRLRLLQADHLLGKA